MGEGAQLVAAGGSLLWLGVECCGELFRRSRAEGRTIQPLAGVAAFVVCGSVAAVIAALLGGAGLPLAAALGVGVVLCCVEPAAALAFLIALLLVRPWELPGAHERLGFVPRGFALLAVGSAARSFLLRPGRGIAWSSGTAVYLALIGWFIAATAISAGPAYLGTVELGNFFPLTVVFLLVPSLFDERRWLELGERAIVIGVVGAVGAAFFNTAAGEVHDGMVGRLTGNGLFGNSNDLAALIVIALSLLGVKTCRNLRAVFSARFAIALLTLGFGLWKTQSRGAVIALGVGGFVYVTACRPSRASPLILAAIAGGITAFFLFVQRDAEDLDGSQASRFNYAVAGVKMARAHPLFGVGMGNYPRLYESYTPSFEEWGERTAHSSWVLALAETGFIGFFLFLGLYGGAVRAAWRQRAAAPEVAVSLVSYGVAMSFLSHTYTLLPYLIAAFAFAADRQASSPAQRQAPAELPRERSDKPWRWGSVRSRAPS